MGTAVSLVTGGPQGLHTVYEWHNGGLGIRIPQGDYASLVGMLLELLMLNISNQIHTQDPYHRPSRQ